MNTSAEGLNNEDICDSHIETATNSLKYNVDKWKKGDAIFYRFEIILAMTSVEAVTRRTRLDF